MADGAASRRIWRATEKSGKVDRGHRLLALVGDEMRSRESRGAPPAASQSGRGAEENGSAAVHSEEVDANSARLCVVFATEFLHDFRQEMCTLEKRALIQNYANIPFRLLQSRRFARESLSMNLRSLFSLFSSDLAIDLGTANTLVFAKGKGIVVNEPSIVAHQQEHREVEAVGKEAKEMLGRTPGNIVAIQPMKDGVIADFKVTERMLNYFIQKAHGRKMLVHPRIVIGVPSEITQVEKRAVIDSAYRAKASEVHLVEQAMVAAIGAGLPITEPSGNMVVDIGGGTTDVAVISLSGIVYSRSVRVAGNEMDDAIMQYLKRKYNLLIGERTAEAIKIEIGSAYPLDKPLTMEIKGRNLIEGVPKTITIDDSEIREALSECVATIMNAIRVALERTPPELSRRYQRPRHRADRRRRAAQESGQAHPRRNRACRFRSPKIRWPRWCWEPAKC